MDDFDLAKALQDLGVSERDSLKVKAGLSGGDLMNLIDALRDTQRGQSLSKASLILGKYGVQIRSHKVQDTNYLKAKFESMRGRRTLDETFDIMKPLDESFSYAIEINEQNRDRVLDWLDENKVEYQATSATAYNIQCGDRDVAYRTGRALSEILRKPTVRDSIEVIEAKKSHSSRVKDAKDKMAKITPEDPHKLAMLTRNGKGIHKDGKDPRKDDKLGRAAKHKPRFDEKIEDDNLHEGVMGMKPLNPLFRLRELAGLPLRANEDDLDGIEIASGPEIDPDGHLAPGPVGMDAEPDGLGDDPVVDPMSDMDGGMDANMDTGMDANMDTGMDGPAGDIDSGMADPMDGSIDDAMADPMADPMIGTDMADPMSGPIDGGAPGDLGSDPVEAVPGLDAPTQSEAMSQIEDGLNNVQTMLADIRLSEYKSLIKKLQDLTNQAQMMGRDYLGERRRK